MAKVDKYFFNMLDDPTYDFTDKKRCINNHIAYMLLRTHSMFRYSGLPDTIPERVIELSLQRNGHVCVTKVGKDLYMFCGAFGGEPDPYYLPKNYIVSNPSLTFNKTLKIGEDCEVIPNDSLYMGLLPLFRRYATSLTENELSMKVATINLRLLMMLSAMDDRTEKSARKFLQDLEDGKNAVISETKFIEGLKVHPLSSGNNNALTNLIEYEQYLKASWYNEIGLNANYNMKRESINSNEAQLNNDALLPLVDDMLECRKSAVDRINSMFGTNIEVELNSSWEQIKEEHSGQPEEQKEEE